MGEAMKRLVPAVCATLALFSCGGAPEGAPDVRKPNFVLIFIDDMGYGDIGAFGSTDNRTPHLDRLAAEGMRLTSFYAHPVCTPSRAALMTGAYPMRNGLQTGYWHPVLMPGDPQGIHADEITVAEALKEQGYATGIIGKWHLGDQPEFLPNAHGFDYYFGLPYSNDMSPFLPLNKRNHPPLPLLRNGEVIREVPEDQSFLTGDYTAEALKFIDAHHGQPFFLYIPHSMVHVPLFAGDDFRGRSSNGILGDAIEELDWSVGEVRKKLEEHGIAENTGPARGSAGPLQRTQRQHLRRRHARARHRLVAGNRSRPAASTPTRPRPWTFCRLSPRWPAARFPSERIDGPRHFGHPQRRDRSGLPHTQRSTTTAATNCARCAAGSGNCMLTARSTIWEADIAESNDVAAENVGNGRPARRSARKRPRRNRPTARCGPTIPESGCRRRPGRSAKLTARPGF